MRRPFLSSVIFEFGRKNLQILLDKGLGRNIFSPDSTATISEGDNKHRVGQSESASA